MLQVPRRLFRAVLGAGWCAASLGLTACGGGGSNPLDNPPNVSNPPGAVGRKLSYVYFQKCINPIFLKPLTIHQNGTTSTNTCAGSGCHDNTSGTGGAFRVVSSAQPVDLGNPANTPEVVRDSDMYKNFYSAQGEVVFGAPMQSRLLTKPMVLNVLHGGGLVFESAEDPNVKLIEYWIKHPMPTGQDEFSSAGNSMFTPADPETGTCNIE
ncbi:hypothetical protein OOT46_12135 [Aquabacterium sp. A7-Y]|uniref:hypothetical protein n=1 Tax=Aquabacterium sp. A7-Y TaxID=1349605 RepID=UPI00223E8CE2|nr:hypothetical protein [Aquabacterium sp. A7-Y]MCW7538591.1 hypothetical protein [Aquabacterium sp. A7-Y]